MSAIAPSWRYGRPDRACDVISRTAAAYRILPQMILKGSRHAISCEARREVIRQLRRYGYSLALIGRVLGGFHHTTILHHLQMARTPDRVGDVPDESGLWA